ncbi:MAG: hypothetical protein JSS98_05825 [Bacteroidetes bacterium]|nr:hypothetical protein [Bacteroidota bacterium]
MPNATQTGANTFACLINGKKFIAYNDVNYIGAAFVNDTLIIGGQSKNKNYIENILLKLVNKPTKKEYAIDNMYIFSSLITDSICSGIVFNIYQFSAISGSIQVTKFDTTRKIVAGSFNCIIPIQTCDTLKITEGRFDIIYH